MVFDPEKVTLVFNDAVITGYADGSDISVERNEDDVAPKTGIQGDTVYALNGNRSGLIKFSLFATSASLARLRRDAQNRVAAACTMRNANDDGGFIVSHPDCRIVKTPGFSGGADAKSIEVGIYVPELIFNE